MTSIRSNRTSFKWLEVKLLFQAINRQNGI